MSGIGRIQSLREESKQEAASRSAVPFREVWFKDGDQAFITSVATGEDNDVNLDEVSLYTFRQGNRFVIRIMIPAPIYLHQMIVRVMQRINEPGL